MFYANPCSKAKAKAIRIAQAPKGVPIAETKLAILRASVDISRLKLKIKA